MDGACDDFFAGAALSANQDGGVALRDAGDELFYLANLAALANEVVGRVELSFQALVFRTQRIERQYVFKRDGGDAGDGIEEVDVVFAKGRRRWERNEIDDADSSFDGHQ